MERQGWRLRREGTVLEHRQHLFTPDFTFTNEESGRTVLLEIVGYLLAGGIPPAQAR